MLLSLKIPLKKQHGRKGRILRSRVKAMIARTRVIHEFVPAGKKLSDGGIMPPAMVML